MPTPDLPLATLHRVVAQISRAAFQASRWVALPHPETGRPVRVWLDSDVALSLISDALRDMSEITKPDWQSELASEGPWEGLMFAAINAGLQQGVFGRRPEDMGTMEAVAAIMGRQWGYYSFEHCGQTFRARVEALYDGEELSLCVWLPAQGPDACIQPYYGAPHSDFAVYAHGWIERRYGFYLLGSDEGNVRHFFATRSLRDALRGCVVTVPDFLVLKANPAKAKT
jgi:hypothetical protein